jgi:hypothetical protein
MTRASDCCSRYSRTSPIRGSMPRCGHASPITTRSGTTRCTSGKCANAGSSWRLSTPTSLPAIPGCTNSNLPTKYAQACWERIFPSRFDKTKGMIAAHILVSSTSTSASLTWRSRGEISGSASAASDQVSAGRGASSLQELPAKSVARPSTVAGRRAKR